MQSKTVYIRNADGTLTPFNSIQDASAELGRALRLRWSATLRARMATAPQGEDIIDARRQSVKGK
jgi:hypothetical protein